MKKNKIFLWAYITAICMSVIVRLCVEYSQWRAIVLGITVSSAFFSMEDLFSSVCRMVRNSCNLLEAYTKESRIFSQKEKDFFEQLQEKVISKSTPIDGNDKIIEASQSRIANINELILSIELLENELNKSRKMLSVYENCNQIITYYGYFILFSAVFFSEFVNLSDVSLELITVVSFATILVTQQLNQHFSEKIKDKEQKYQTMLKKQEDAIKVHTDLEQNVDEMLEIQRRIFENEEEIKQLTAEIERMEALKYAN